MRRAPQLGQNPRRLQLKAIRCSPWQDSQRTRRTPLEATALEVGREFLLHVVRQRSALPGQEFDERRVVLRDDAVGECSVRA